MAECIIRLILVLPRPSHAPLAAASGISVTMPGILCWGCRCAGAAAAGSSCSALFAVARSASAQCQHRLRTRRQCVSTTSHATATWCCYSQLCHSVLRLSRQGCPQRYLMGFAHQWRQPQHASLVWLRAGLATGRTRCRAVVARLGRHDEPA